MVIFLPGISSLQHHRCVAHLNALLSIKQERTISQLTP